jgi:hypothetical protein
MNNGKDFFTTSKVKVMLGAMLLAALTGCVGYVDGPRADVYVAPPAVEVGVQDNYVYYPGYDVYYNSHLQLYAYMDGGVWVSRPEPRGVSINVLLASPSVRMDFHDSPANHHAEVAQRYPRNWAPSGTHSVQKAQVEKAQVKKPQARKTNQKPEKRDEHEGK